MPQNNIARGPRPDDARDEDDAGIERPEVEDEKTGDDGAVLAGSPTERERITESQFNLMNPLGVDVAPAIMPAITRVTEAMIASCDQSIEALGALRAQIQAHARHLQGELDERDARVRQVLKDHGELAKDSGAEFARIQGAVAAIADARAIEDGKPIPTSSDT